MPFNFAFKCCCFLRFPNKRVSWSEQHFRMLWVKYAFGKNNKPKEESYTKLNQITPSLENLSQILRNPIFFNPSSFTQTLKRQSLFATASNWREIFSLLFLVFVESGGTARGDDSAALKVEWRFLRDCHILFYNNTGLEKWVLHGTVRNWSNSSRPFYEASAFSTSSTFSFPSSPGLSSSPPFSSPSPCMSLVHNVRLSLSSCMIRVESL